MILLRPDCLVFKLASGENVPCAVDDIAVELVGEAVRLLDHEVVRNAAEAVLHYFKHELGRDQVTIGEFTMALERVLKRLGINVTAEDFASLQSPAPAETDLRQLVTDSGGGCELFFFPRLRAQLREHLEHSARVVRFRGLRACVKQLTGARRWTARCQALNDQIVEYLRTCLSNEQAPHCALVVD